MWTRQVPSGLTQKGKCLMASKVSNGVLGTSISLIKSKASELDAAVKNLEKYQATIVKTKKYAENKSAYTKRFNQQIYEQKRQISILSQDRAYLTRQNRDLRNNTDPAWYFIALLATEGSELWDNGLMTKLAHRAGLLMKVDMKSVLNEDVKPCDKCPGNCEVCYRVTRHMLTGVSAWCDLSKLKMTRKPRRKKK
jgi:hypothetical protein